MKLPLLVACVPLILSGGLFASLGLGQKSNSHANQAWVRSEPSVYDELANAPEKARAKRNPLEKDPEAAAAGGNLFEQHCAECHGNAAEGGKKGPSLRAVEVQTAEPGAIFWVLTNGVVRKGMPVWSKLPEPQRWQIVSFVKSLGTGAKPDQAKPSAVPPPESQAGGQ